MMTEMMNGLNTKIHEDRDHLSKQDEIALQIFCSMLPQCKSDAELTASMEGSFRIARKFILIANKLKEEKPHRPVEDLPRAARTL